VAEQLLRDGHQGKSGKKKRKKYTLKRDIEIMTPLEKLVLALSDTTDEAQISNMLIKEAENILIIDYHLIIYIVI
jgi:hypothetical protein